MSPASHNLTPSPSATSTTLEVMAESDGGATVHLGAGMRSVRIVPSAKGPPLRALEVVMPPSVRSLDLSALPSGPWVRLEGALGLDQLCLPADAAKTGRRGRRGTDLHLTLEQPPMLRIEGAVSALDACWSQLHGGTVRVREVRTRGPGRKPWHSVWFGTQPTSEPVDAMVLALPGGQGQLSLQGPLRCLEIPHSGLQSLAVHDVSNVVLADSAHLRSVSAHKCDRLKVRQCPKLAVVNGAGAFLSVVESAAVERLQVSGAWDMLVVRDGRCVQLDAPEVSQIALNGHSRVRRVLGAPGHGLAVQGVVVPDAPQAGDVLVEEGYIEVIANLLQNGESVAPSVLTLWVDQAGGPSGQQDRLVALAIGLEKSAIEPTLAWQLRTRLVADGKHARDTQGRPAWMWKFPADLADRGWRADLRLWWSCRESVPEAQAYDEVIRRAQSVLGLATLAEALRRWPALEAFLHAALVAPLPRMRKRRKARGPYPHEDLAPDVVFARVVRGLVQARDQVHVSRLGDALASNLQKRIEHGQSLVSVLASLHQLGSPAAASCLASIATMGRLDPEVQREALVALLAAPHPDAQPFLAPPEDSP